MPKPKASGSVLYDSGSSIQTAIDIMKIYFDATDIAHWAGHSDRVTGIQRVELNIVRSLARDHGGDVIRGVFFDRDSSAFYEFDPASLAHAEEFSAESLLIDLGLQKTSRIFPSKVQIKSYLRQAARGKLQRTLKKADIYFSALLAPARLHRKGLAPSARNRQVLRPIAVKKITALPPDSCLACLGTVWLFPELRRFAAEHRARGGEVLQMVHDLIAVSNPQYFRTKVTTVFRHWLDEALQYATRFACVSSYTADDLRRYAAERNMAPAIHVTRLAHEFVGFERNAEIPLPPQLTELADREFVLAAGTIDARKNGVSLLQTWRRLIGEFADKTPLLLFAGMYGRVGGAELRAELESDDLLAEFVRVVDGPSDHELAWLYKHCLFSAFPSHVEGWGLPVGESAWFGSLCVASKASAIPEVCGDLMDYVDPADSEDITRAVRRLITDRDYLQLRKTLIARARLRRWSDVAADLYDCLQQPAPLLAPA
jgi:glycosyltransferase involved in cell wall biosynthesis